MAHHTVRDITFLLTNPAGPIENTVDQLIAGDPDTVVQGIATAFMPTQHVIEQAVAAGCNLLITHEGLYYSHHHTASEALKDDAVFKEKQDLIRKSGIAIFRFHDSIHRYKPDGITEGLVLALDWQPFVRQRHPASTIITFPAMTLGAVAEHIKSKLNIPCVRYMGDLSMRCRHVGLLVGYRGGGKTALSLYEEENLDLIIYGEGPEWETPEYVRDSLFQNRSRSLLVLGHAESEDPGMRYLAEQIKRMCPEIPVQHIPAEPLFRMS